MVSRPTFLPMLSSEADMEREKTRKAIAVHKTIIIIKIFLVLWYNIVNLLQYICGQPHRKAVRSCCPGD